MCSHVCISPAGARSNHISVRNTVHGVATGPQRPFSIVKYFLNFFPASLAVVYVFLIFVLRLHPFPPFSVSPYIRMYVRALLGPVGACVRLCLRVLLPADVPSATRVRHSNFSSVNEIRWMRFGINVIVSLCVVVYAPTGPGASFSETPFSRPWT